MKFIRLIKVWVWIIRIGRWTALLAANPPEARANRLRWKIEGAKAKIMKYWNVDLSGG